MVGVIIGRFQTPYLTDGHRFLIDRVFERHADVIILIGVSKGQPTKRNPLGYEERRTMLQKSYPTALIEAIEDRLSDTEWSQAVDSIIHGLRLNEATLYGCRDSFITYYSGEHKTCILETPHEVSATGVRAQVSKEVLDSEHFRRGVIYATTKRIPSPFLTVDVAMIKAVARVTGDLAQWYDYYVLLAKKSGEQYFRFIGGFVDSSDESITHSAKRELFEETGGVEADDFKLIGETRINDWRYAKDEENIFTCFFTCKYIFGTLRS